MRVLRVILCGVVFAGCTHVTGSSPLPADLGNAGTLAQRPHGSSSYVSLYSFRGGASDGANPSGLTPLPPVSAQAPLVGTTENGGARGQGTVFYVALPVMGGVVEKTLYGFTGGNPMGGVIFGAKSMYGTTYEAGANGVGGVFSFFDSAGSIPNESLIYSFKSAPDGANPEAGVILWNGSLYGTTWGGGTSNNGTVFVVSENGEENVLYGFKGAPDGSQPQASLIVANGALYGTTRYGGTSGNGTVFELSASGNERVLYSFEGGKDGANPQAALLLVNKGVLWGTTTYGGPGNHGTVFGVRLSDGKEMRYGFKGGKDGANPEASLIYRHEQLIGTTKAGGTAGFGTIFGISPLTGHEQVFYSFQGVPDGAYPESALVELGGTLYGTTIGGGKSNYGTVFSIDP